VSPAGSRFDPLVDAYDAARPSYPAALFDRLEALTRPLQGAMVVEIGAGTGIATRPLRSRGARVLALDVSPPMLERLRTRSPDQDVVVGSGEALPVRHGVADLVYAAQAWHWLDDLVAAREAIRVLRPGGHLAVWWNNVAADGMAWFDAQQNRLEAMSPGYTRDYRSRPTPEPLGELGLFDGVEVVTLSWSRSLPLDDYLVWLTSKSYVHAIGDRRQEFLDAERASLAAVFPDGVVVEPFDVRLVVARTPKERPDPPVA
jgi:SAM-dependent methyltransferase